MSDFISPQLSIVMVTYNSVGVVLDALRPIARRPMTEIIVVDNDSHDDGVERIRAAFPNVTVIPQNDNTGFARAVNVGVRASTGAILMLLNPDAIITTAAIDALLDGLEQPRVGVVAPLLVDPHGHQKIVAAGWMPTVWRMLTHYSGLSRLGQRAQLLQGHYLLPNQLHSPTEVDWVTGACFAIRRRDWDSVGGLSEQWFMYAEDIEFCFRVRAKGLRIRLLPDVKATHIVGGSDSTESQVRSGAWVVNLRDFYARDLAITEGHAGLWTAVVWTGLNARSLALRLRARHTSDTAVSQQMRRRAHNFDADSRALLLKKLGA